MAVHAARVRDGVRFGRRPHAARRGSVAAPGRAVARDGICEAVPTGGAVMRRLAASIVLTFSLSFASAGGAAEEPKVTLEATLDTAQEVPSPKGTLPDAGGSATFEYDETDKSIAYAVTVMNLTGPPIIATLHRMQTEP